MNRIWKLAVVLVALGSVSVAQADLISYDFSGTLSNVDDSGNLLDGAFSLGDTFTGSFSYESDSPDGSPSDTYFTSPAQVSITTAINGYLFTSRIGSVDLNSDADGIYFISGFNSDPFIELGDNPGRLMTLYFFDDTGSLYDDDVLPLSLDLNDFSGTLFQLFGDTGPGGPYFGMTGSISSLTPCSPFPGGGATGGCFPGPGPFPAPEPGTLALLTIGLLGMGMSRRSRQLA